ncbi:Haloacid dehalogenase-like hydrolase [Novymonas esmeraldas]|uniref:Haloacid dehalogenase-like hydrolase n=1 Tax=Novymonas esmeraldas TaxID=1808958 RepID=A0AAW0EMI1_9TRYP
MASSLATPVQVRELLHSVDYLLIDLDGVVWSGETIIPQVPETLAYLRSIGKQLRFVSNTILLKRSDLVNHFESLGIHGVHPHEIYTAAYTTALYVQERFGSAEDEGRRVHGNVFVFGPVGLHDEIQAVLAPGYSTYGSELTSIPYSPDMVARGLDEPLFPAPRHAREARPISLKALHPVAVVVGMDYAMNMTELAAAVALLQTTAAAFVATNPDPADPAGPQRVLLPSSGAILAAAVTALGRQPDVLCGKPSATMGHLLLEREAAEGKSVSPQRTVMIGDRLMTDIQFGKAIGARTALVLSGAQKLEHLDTLVQEENKTAELPDLVLRSIADFLEVAERKD